jgi:hypothetical protein
MRRRLLNLAVSLYPAAWRERYGEEFAATIDAMPGSSWAIVWDISKSAIAERIRHRGNIKQFATIFGTAGLALALAISSRIPDLYISESAVQTSNADSAAMAQSVKHLLSRHYLQSLIEKHRLYIPERSNSPMEEVIDSMSRNISVAVSNADQSRRTIKVRYANTNPAETQIVASELATTLAREYNPRQASAQGSNPLTLLSPASAPDAIYPNRRNIALVGLFCGTLFGALLSLVYCRKPQPASS